MEHNFDRANNWCFGFLPKRLDPEVKKILNGKEYEIEVGRPLVKMSSYEILIVEGFSVMGRQKLNNFLSFLIFIKQVKGMKIEGKTALAMVLFVVSVFMVMLKFMLPTTIQVLIEGQSIFVREMPNVYTVLDCILIAIFSFLLGVSAFYLFITYSVMPEKARAEHEVEPGEAGSESALQVQDADTDADIPDTNVQVPETSKSSVAPEDNRSGLLKILKGNEKRVIEALMEYGEMNQADLSARTGIPKSTLSRLLQDLEDRSLIFRYEYGMSKMVKLEVR